MGRLTGAFPPGECTLVGRDNERCRQPAVVQRPLSSGGALYRCADHAGNVAGDPGWTVYTRPDV